MPGYFISQPVAKRMMTKSKLAVPSRIPAVTSKLKMSIKTASSKIKVTGGKPTVSALKTGKSLKLKHQGLKSAPVAESPVFLAPSLPEPIALQVAVLVPKDDTRKLGFTVEGSNSLRSHGENSTVFTFDRVVPCDENLSQNWCTLLSSKEDAQVSTAILLTGEEEGILSNEPTALASVVEGYWAQVSQHPGQMHFGFAVAVAGEVHDLLNSTARKGTRPHGYSRRAILNPEHALDLVQLGKLTGKGYEAKWKGQSHFYVYHFYMLNGECTSKHFFIVEGCTISIESDTMQLFESCLRARQRDESYPGGTENALMTILQPALQPGQQSAMSLVYSLPAGESLSQKTLLMLECLQRIKLYGTEEDIHGGNIIQLNEELLDSIEEGDSSRVYLHLLNNVSVLEKDLLDGHKQLTEKMVKWSENHQGLEKLSQNESFDPEQYLAKLMPLLTEEKSRIDQLIESANYFQTGLAQLKQSIKGEGGQGEDQKADN